MLLFFYPPDGILDSDYKDFPAKADEPLFLGTFEVFQKTEEYISCIYIQHPIIDLSQYSSFLSFEDLERLSLLVQSSSSNTTLTSPSNVAGPRSMPTGYACPKFISGYSVSQLKPTLNHVRSLESSSIVNLLVLILEVQDSIPNKLVIWVADPTLVYFPIHIWNLSKKASIEKMQVVFWTQIFIKATKNCGVISGHATSSSKIIQYGTIENCKKFAFYDYMASLHDHHS